MSTAKQEARAIRAAIEKEIEVLPKADRAAVRAVAQKIRDAIAEGNAQEQGLGVLALGLVGTEMQEQAS